MTSIRRQARMMESADKDAWHKWPILTPEKAQALKDEAWDEFVKAYLTCEGDPGEYRKVYMQRVEDIERAANFGD